MAHTGAGGFVHSSIPLAAKAVEALGNQGGLWTTTISYDAADISAANLKQYDAIFLDSTTSCFLDDPNPSVTAARRAAFLDFVRSGKGIAGIHAATDSYHSDCLAALAAAGRGAGGGRGGRQPPWLPSSWHRATNTAQATRRSAGQEFAALADNWFDKLDTDKTGKISQADFASRFNAAIMPARPPAGTRAGRGGGEAPPVLQWPEFNKLIGGYFKFHWSVPQLITTTIDDPKRPLTAMFHGQEFEIHDETYTFAQDSFSRANVHVLTSIDYDKMSAADKAKEQNPRTDGDYALSYIRREGRGRVFYEGHGHSERIYAITPMLEHIRAGIQYALGDLKVTTAPLSSNRRTRRCPCRSAEFGSMRAARPPAAIQRTAPPRTSPLPLSRAPTDRSRRCRITIPAPACLRPGKPEPPPSLPRISNAAFRPAPAAGYRQGCAPSAMRMPISPVRRDIA